MRHIDEIGIILVAIPPVHPRAHRAEIATRVPLVDVGVIDAGLGDPGSRHGRHVEGAGKGLTEGFDAVVFYFL